MDLDKVQGKIIKSISFRNDYGLCIFLKGGDVLEVEAPVCSEWNTADKVRVKHGARFVNLFINCVGETEDDDFDCWDVNTVQVLTTRGSLTWTVKCDSCDDLVTHYHKGGLNARN